MAISSNWDVVVLGGGSAGIAAAISASRTGAKTLLVERSDILGGNATQAFVHTICGLYLAPAPGSAAGNLAYANPGFAFRFANWLLSHGAALPPEIHGKVGVLPTVPERMAELIEHYCANLPGLTVLLNASLDGLEADFSGFTANIRADHCLSSLSTKFLLDTSGDAAAAAGIEALTDTPDASEVQHPSYIFRVSGANPIDLKGYNRLKLGLAFTKASQAGRLPADLSSVLVRPATRAGEAYISINMPKPEGMIYNPLEAKCITIISEQARSWADLLVEFLRNEFSAWADCQIVEWPRRLGIRETRRVRGRYVMTSEDVLEGRTRPDQVAKSTWPIELWNHHTGAQFSYPAGPCSIPLDALISAGHPRLGMAGRCMSGTHEALGALRVIGTALATGEGIGLAAAWAVQNNSTLDQVSAQAIEELRHQFNDQELP